MRIGRLDHGFTLIRIAAQRGTASSFRWRSIAVLANSQTCARSIANFYLANEPILAPSRRHSINHAPFHARTSIIPWCRCRRSRKAISRELLQARGDSAGSGLLGHGGRVPRAPLSRGACIHLHLYRHHRVLIEQKRARSKSRVTFGQKQCLHLLLLSQTHLVSY